MEASVRDEERLRKLTRAMEECGLDGLLCTLPSNVLLLSGYWPVVGNAIAVATRGGSIFLVTPEDERQLAQAGWAGETRTFRAGSLDSLVAPLDAVLPALAGLRQAPGFGMAARIGFEGGPVVEPSGYAAGFRYGDSLPGLVEAAFPGAAAVDATGCLARLKSVMTRREAAQIRRGCNVARRAFEAAAQALKPGMREVELAALLRAHLVSGTNGDRCDGFAYCESGPESAQAYAAFQQSRCRPIAEGDFVLVHCNSYFGGMWTDITRTFCAGKPDPEKARIIDSVLEAGRQAFRAVRPGVRAAEVDRAAREVLNRRGFGDAFKHATGHGVGFAAIDHNARPRIHPLSDEVLEPGMVFNIEPAVYLSGLGGMRHCDMVLVTDGGAELLTPFLNSSGELVSRLRDGGNAGM